ncbi:MAG: hypothetical protein LJE65_02285 [Desulfobacteraceae bacterium]|nr:hypothetical protein [Desulfobacteraceae bacterium]
MKNLRNLLLANEEWLMDRILGYAIQQGYAVYTSTLKEAWRLSIAGLSASIFEGLAIYDGIPEIGPEDDFAGDPISLFGITEAKRHRERGVSLGMFLGLMKYYRQAYVDLLHRSDIDETDRQRFSLFIHRIFDRIEIGFCVEWSGAGGDKAVQELQKRNRLMTNEKNKYLTIFESIPNPVILLDRNKAVDSMNLAAAELFEQGATSGSQYYGSSKGGHSASTGDADEGEELHRVPSSLAGHDVSALLPWIQPEIDRFYNENLSTMVFEKRNEMEDPLRIFRVKLSKSLDVSGKFEGTVVILEDITSLKSALDEVHTLRGLLPICSHCKNIRDDKGFWQKVEHYVGERTNAAFSHSICPDCARKLYPEIVP